MFKLEDSLVLPEDVKGSVDCNTEGVDVGNFKNL